DSLILHGSVASRLLRGAKSGLPVCVTVTLLDGLVLARSVFHHSMNYRSVVVLGVPEVVDDPAEKRAALDCLTEHLIPGRVTEAREPNDRELAKTLVLRLSLEEASAKVRTGPPGDEPEDYRLPVWAGVIPIRTQFGPPEADPELAEGIPTAPSALAYRRP
ncbi:MAG: pyridoxamine 5'-phosphate oxidase family protein, partial [Gemmatimonadetes bacterium]|nr:pyridoxamine 5'-phosphate oxidase family protein [Gemmatimonadota bacterium]